ncbi:MAG: hypothetical protein ucyna2_00531 [Candidatus Atelocyanobacterium thalassa isolate SIO64986]|uniref:Uncharacterized protein n=1 Tax=Candidatus Atelocyanobacterium thalassa isolate SIO64986 TaxID=1527444 RepID=A0A086CHJ1_9CHRO|nr:MAG: hypothetical protein ucyna2_00531 [Candidatus Atelocyanobacterium thalassa isolate SIO64986]
MCNSRFNLVNNIYLTMRSNKILFKLNFFIIITFLILFSSFNKKIYGQNIYPNSNLDLNDSINQSLGLSSEIVNSSKVLQRWTKEIPNILEEIRYNPSFKTRIGLGYSEFPSNQHDGGFIVKAQDIFFGKKGLSISGDYQTSFTKRDAGGIDLQYYLLPLGYYFNVAPLLGYRTVSTNNYSEDGLNIGGKLILALSRSGASDISITQTFLSPGSTDEVGVINLSFGYAVTSNMRLSTEIKKQNSRVKKDSQVSILLEWMP